MKHYLNRMLLIVAPILGFAAVTTQGQNYVSGMPLDHALDVATQCVMQASSYNEKNSAKPGRSNPDFKTFNREGIRAQDTLEFLGINDAVRLDSLRRYLVGNQQFGVGSVWEDRGAEIGVRPYFMTRAAVSTIEKSWTVTKLALLISSSSQIPVLSRTAIAGLLATCRRDVLSPMQKTDPIPVTSEVDDLIRNTGFSKFEGCVLPNMKVGKFKFEDNQGDLLDVEFLGSADQWKTTVKGSVYSDLISYIEVNSKVVFSSDLEVLIFLVNEVLRRDQICRLNQKTFKIEHLCSEINDKTTLEDLGFTNGDLPENKTKQSNNLDTKRAANDADVDLSLIHPKMAFWRAREVLSDDRENRRRKQ